MALPQIRDANPHDVEDLFAVRCSVDENYLSPEELAERGITPETVRLMIQSGGYLVPVALVDGVIAGFGMADIAKGYVFALFVRLEHEGKGLGRALLRALEAGFIEHGVTQVWLHTGSEEGIRAPGFYQHLGWRFSGLMRDGQLKFCKTLG